MISVILPTFNERKNIVLISKKLSSIKLVNDVIFVDDRSTDGTLSEIKKIKKKKFRGFSRKSKNRDLSKSVIYGANKARNKYVVVMDCDLQHDVNYIFKMWKKFTNSKSDIIIAYEPVWSIGTGIIPKSNDLIKSVNFIKSKFGSKSPKILYGGSVNDQNISQLKNISTIDGFLIGGASQDPKKFIDIIKKTYN